MLGPKIYDEFLKLLSAKKYNAVLGAQASTNRRFDFQTMALYFFIQIQQENMPYTITLIRGDGIGPEISRAATRVIEAAGVKIEWDVQEAGFNAIEKHKDPLPQAVIDSIAKNKVALKGPL